MDKSQNAKQYIEVDLDLLGLDRILGVQGTSFRALRTCGETRTTALHGTAALRGPRSSSVCCPARPIEKGTGEDIATMDPKLYLLAITSKCC